MAALKEYHNDSDTPPFKTISAHVGVGSVVCGGTPLSKELAQSSGSFLGRNRLGNRHTISGMLLRRSARSPIAPFKKISGYFQNIVILSIISRYFDENHSDTYLNIHCAKN
ncbi:hypothetical protein DVH24_021690 [Malus domestica]|uniref:Uncharacterized protein n=1 Tax=Malus domestica TaxID=3750 RepID=A0A498JVH4_MALDO|nr:hypothetical protein DVH24_021690 [Malus domestica]